MAFPVGWNRKCKLTVQASQVSGTQTSFPCLLLAAQLPNEMVTSGGGNAAQSNGGDIRFSSDSAGSTQLPCELVQWTQNANPALATAEIWVTPASISSGGNVDIYVWYNAGGGQTLPAANSTYGSQAVWDANFKGVWHLPNGSTLSYTDSKGVNTGTGVNTPTAAAGKIDGGMQLDGTSPYVNIGHDTSLNVGDVFTVEAWVNTNGGVGTTRCTVFSSRISNTAGSFSCEVGTANSITNSMIMTGIGTYIAQSVGSLIFNSTWYHLVWTKNGGATPVMYVNGAAVTLNSSAAYTVVDNATDKMIGTGAAGGLFLWAIADEVRLSGSVRSANWISTEYNNQNTPASFWAVGTPGPSGGSSTQLLSSLGCGA